MSAKENKTLVRRLFEEAIPGDLDLLRESFADDYVDHCRWENREGLCHMISGFRAAFPKLKCKVEDMIAEGDKVAARVMITGNGKEMEKTIKAVAIYRIENGKIVEHWGHSDSFF